MQQQVMDAKHLRPLLGLRVRLAAGATFDDDAGVLWVPRRNPVERLMARLLHRGEARVRLALDDRSRDVVRAILAEPDPSVPRLFARLGVLLPGPETPAADWHPDVVALLAFLLALARGRALVTQPI